MDYKLGYEGVPMEIVVVLGVTVVGILLTVFKRYVNGPRFRVPDVDLRGKVAVVTGGNAGIGFQVAKELALKGCFVIIGARNKANAEQSIKIIKEADSKAEVEYIFLDLSDKSSIQTFASVIKPTKIDFLVNNAGIMGIPSRKLTKQGVQMQWGVNHLGHFYLTYLLWPKLVQSDFFRVVNVSSRAHRWFLGFFYTITLDFNNINFDKEYDKNMAYSRSKLYNVLFTKALAEKIDENLGMIVSVNPGVVRTDIIRELTGDGLKGKVLDILLRLVWPIFCLFTKDPHQGASTSLYTLFASNLKTGCYYTDCKLCPQSQWVTKDNWIKLWQISQHYLNIRFAPQK